MHLIYTSKSRSSFLAIKEKFTVTAIQKVPISHSRLVHAAEGGRLMQDKRPYSKIIVQHRRSHRIQTARDATRHDAARRDVTVAFQVCMRCVARGGTLVAVFVYFYRYIKCYYVSADAVRDLIRLIEKKKQNV